MKYIGTITAAASGSIAGCVFSRNHFGSYVRNRAIPINPGSVQQSVVRSAMAAATQAWSATLTQAQRDGWNAYAAAVPKQDALGFQIFLLGINWFVAVNVLRIQDGEALLLAAPTILTGTSLTPPTINNIDVSEANVDFNITIADPWNDDAGGRLYVFASRGTNASREFFKGPFRLAGSFSGTVAANPLTVGLPFAVAVGQKVWVRFIAQTVDGRLSADFITNAIAQA